ncbi:TerD family protein [Solimonas sp. K1W22B-7]|uniref:TerD family protein n=1 Tax=Solimonas sp. K1W22B-7 TaxID=2303331 RepID=UPI000E3372E6|nr:TerD family protein [Solimonas sp. K1W22B-7]AXQ27502.1 TerD family protein [Solimonas sp. K1W22B-7]
MAINLQKGQRVNVSLVRVGVGLGWQANTTQGTDYDLDATAFMLGANQKLPADEFFVYYNNLASPDTAVKSSGDDQRGGGNSDNETLSVDLSMVDARVQEILFCVSIHDAATRRQNFGQVRQSFVRLYDLDSGAEFAKYELDEDFSVETAVELGRLYRRDGSWRFEALGKGYRGGLEELVNRYQ